MLEREAIYQRVWGYAMAHGDRSVDVFVRKLRQKLEKRSPGWSYIHTHFGVGYRFDPDPAAGVEASTPPPAAPCPRSAARRMSICRRCTRAEPFLRLPHAAGRAMFTSGSPELHNDVTR